MTQDAANRAAADRAPLSITVLAPLKVPASHVLLQQAVQILDVGSALSTPSVPLGSPAPKGCPAPLPDILEQPLVHHCLLALRTQRMRFHICNDASSDGRADPYDDAS